MDDTLKTVLLAAGAYALYRVMAIPATTALHGLPAPADASAQPAPAKPANFTEYLGQLAQLGRHCEALRAGIGELADPGALLAARARHLMEQTEGRPA